MNCSTLSNCEFSRSRLRLGSSAVGLTVVRLLVLDRGTVAEGPVEAVRKAMIDAVTMPGC